MIRDEKGPVPTFDRDYAVPGASAPREYERTAEQKAAGAQTVADNFDNQLKVVREAVTAMHAAATGGDPAGWRTAKGNADQGLRQLEHLAKAAATAVHEAADPDVKERLAGVDKALKDARQLVTDAPAATTAAGPTLSCGDALLAALPPVPTPPAWHKADFEAAYARVKAVIAHEMTSSDIAAFRAVVHHADHVIARRFQRFNSQRRSQLLALLDQSDVKRSAHAREVKRRAGAADDARNRASEEAQPTSAEVTSEVTPTTFGGDDTQTTDRSEGGPAMESTTDEGTGASGQHEDAALREGLGSVIAARVPGVTYEGTGRFRVASGERLIVATIQRVQTGAARIRHDADAAAVLEIPTGLDENALATAVATQLRALQSSHAGVALPSEAGGAGGSALPYRAEMERSFGRSLGDVQVFTGAAAELAPYGARALATGNVIAFADHAPSPSLVAHEVAHKVQNEQAGASAPMAAGVVAPRDSAAEAEAENVASMVAAHGPGVKLPPITAAPAAHVHLSPDATGVPALRLDKTKDAARLRSLIGMHRQPEIVELLEQNANPEHMYALHRAYGSALVADIQGALTEASYLARARVYLGEQMSLDAKIQSRGPGDIEAILSDLEKLPDVRALALVAGEAVPIAWTQPAVASWLPASTTLAAVKQALRSRVGADDYYRAMRLVLGKAERALAVQVAQAPPGQNLDGFTVTMADLGTAHAHASPLTLSPVSSARVDLAETRIREVDASGNWMTDPMKSRTAALAMTDLSGAERQALALRLRDRPLGNTIGGGMLTADALEHDDATFLRKAIIDAQAIAAVQARASRGVGLEVAMERAGDLVRAARAKLEALPPSAPDAERKAAQAELARLESMFFGPSSPVLAMARTTAQRSGAADGGVVAVGAQLHALGADNLTIGAEQLRAVPTGDGAALVATLRKIAAADRMGALQRAGLLDALSSGSLKLTSDQREQVRALVWQGAQPTELGAHAEGPHAGEKASTPANTGDAPIVMPPDLTPPLLGLRPELVLALHDILDAMGRGAADQVLGRLVRMPDADQRAIYAEPRYRAKFNALPEGGDKSPARDLKEALRQVERTGARDALLHFPGPGGDGDVYQRVLLESMGARIEGQDQARMRRAYVLVEQLGGRQQIANNPALLAKLPPTDRRAVEQLIGKGDAGLLGERDHLVDRPSDKETANQLIFGQPGLGGGAGAPGTLDSTTEAEFMYYRLREAAHIRQGVAVADWLSTAGPSADESVAEFMMLYQRVHGAGISRGDLAQLADLYHRARRRLDSYKDAADSLASTAAQIVGATVATIVVTVASGGALGPVAVGAMATVSAAASSAATGAALRVHSTLSTVLKDASTGAIEGLTAAVGASLTARIVRGATVGLPAGRAAASIGARAVSQAGHGGAELAAMVIDGALGNTSGELFQTATDEATWDRGIAEAIAAMLAALERGAVTGAAMGGAVGGAGQIVGKLARSMGKAAEHAASDEASALAHGHAHETAPVEHGASASTPGQPSAAEPRGTPGSDWVEHLKGQLAPDAQARLAMELKTKTPQQLMDSFHGDIDLATTRLSTPGGEKLPAPKDTADMFGVGPVPAPKFAPARRAYLEDPAHWTQERQALHVKLLAKAKQQAQAFADVMKGGEPTLYAMRGNTAAGKTRAVSNNVPELSSAMSATKDLPHRSVNPDNFKADLMAATPGMTSQDVHWESSMLAARHEKQLAELMTSDGRKGSILIDKRLATVGDVQAYAKMAKDTGRKFVLYDVDAPLETSLAGVLERVPGGADPLPPFDVVAGGFAAVRVNREPVIGMFVADPSFGDYVLYGTTSSGQRVEAATVTGGKLTVKNEDLYKLARAEDASSTEVFAKTRITSSVIDELIRDLPADRAEKVGAILHKYEGWTWKAALDAHSVEKSR